MRSKYLISLVIVAASILLPGLMARSAGASIDTLAPLAASQMFALLAFLLTVPASLVMGIIAGVKKEWKRMGLMIAGLFLPWITWWAAISTNGLGWEAVMGI